MKSAGSVACLAVPAWPPCGVSRTKYFQHIFDLFRARSRAGPVSSSAEMCQLRSGEQVSVELDKEQLRRQVVAVVCNTGLHVYRPRVEEFLVDPQITVVLKVSDARLASVLVGNSFALDTENWLEMEQLVHAAVRLL